MSDPHLDPKQVIIVRKDLNMRKGKMCAQVAHASMKVVFDLMETNTYNDGLIINNLYFDKDSFLDKWINGCFKKIVVGADTVTELIEAYQQAKREGILCSLIEDKGLTEFGGKVTITAVAIGPDEPSKIDLITSKFKLL